MKAHVRQFNFPTIIRFGKGALEEIPDHLQTEKFIKPLIVVDTRTASLPFFSELISNLNARGLHPEVFNLFESVLTESTAKSGATHFRNTECDCIVAAGSSAALSAGRAIALFVHHENPIQHYINEWDGENKITQTIPHFIVIPLGSCGDEVARSIELRDEITLEKSVIFSPRLMARVVFADPSVTIECTDQRIREWKMENYASLVESWFSRIDHPICNGIALEGLITLIESEYSVDAKSRSNEALLLTSLMAGISRQKGTGLLHAMVSAVSAYSGCSSGAASAILINPVLKFSLGHNQEAILRLGQRLCWREKTEEAILSKLIGWTEHLALPERLSEIGIFAPDLDLITGMIWEDPVHTQSPRAVTRSEIKSLLIQAL